jgi:hypothetical protein
MKKILNILFALALVLGFSLVVATPVTAAPPQTFLWGVTGVNFYSVGDYSEVFKVDTGTGAVTIVGAHTSGSLYSDIAMTPNGNLFAVGMDKDGFTGSPNNFNDLYRLDPCTGAVLQSWINVFPNNGFRHINALVAESDTSLLAIEGGGVCPGWGYSDGPKLLRINLDYYGSFLNIADLGTIRASGAESHCSDGDLDKDPISGKWYAGFWASSGSEIIELNLSNPSSSTLISQSNIQYQGGFAFLNDGTAYVGCWADEKLYAVNVSGGGNTLAWDLSASLAGPIYGLSRDYPMVSVATTTNTGTTSFTTSNGCITELAAQAPPAGAPAGVVSPHGMFAFKILCISGSTVTLNVTLPGPVPVGTKWWKYQNGSWYWLPIGSDDGDNFITVTLTDNGQGDEDSILGQITDDGGPGNPGAVGWENYPISKVRVLLPWITLGAVIVASASLLVLRRRRIHS